MDMLVILFGALIALMGLVIMAKPVAFVGYMQQHSRSSWLHQLAIIARFILGAALIGASPGSLFPMVLYVLGILSIIAALVFLFMGHTRFIHLLDWASGKFSRFARVSGLVATIFGLFLVYAVV